MVISSQQSGTDLRKRIGGSRIAHRAEHASAALREQLRDIDTVARLGGDEFIVLFRNVENKAELSARTTALLAALCRPIEIDGAPTPVAASLGFALYPDDGETIREVMHVADTALYAEKRLSKARPQAVASSRQAAA